MAGSRISVRVVVQTARYARSKAELYGAHPTITPEAIEEALAYYAAHRAEIDRYIKENDDALESDDW